MKLRKRVVLFGTVGTLGFLVDAGVFSVFESILGPYFARIISFASAVLSTWVMNRGLTFRDRRAECSEFHEIARYSLYMMGGGGLNYLIFALLITWAPHVSHYPLIGIAAGSLAGMGFNFYTSKTFLYNQPKRG